MLLLPPIVAIGSAGGAATVAVATLAAAGRALAAVPPLEFVVPSQVERVLVRAAGGLDEAVSPLVPRHVPESMSLILGIVLLANMYLAGKSFSMLVTKVKPPPLTPESLLWWCFLPSCKGYKAIQFFVEL